MDLFARAGRREQAVDSATTIAALFEPPFESMPALGELPLYSTLEDRAGLEAALAKARAIVSELGFAGLEADIRFGEARVLELHGDCDGALPEYRRAMELRPGSIGWIRDLARCLRNLGRLDEAASELESVLQQGAFPLHLLELAKVENERGDVDAALAHLDGVLEIWSEADAEYGPAQEARTLSESWREGR